MHIFLILLIFGAGLGFFMVREDYTNIPTFAVSCVATMFAYYAYHHTREKFRLELMEKRYEIYENIVVYCSIIAKHGGFPPRTVIESAIDHPQKEEFKKDKERLYDASQRSFRGLGYHSSKILFGEDVSLIFKELNEIYSFFYTYDHSEDKNQRHSYLKRNQAILNSAPDIFGSYVSFQEYKNPRGLLEYLKLRWSDICPSQPKNK